MKVKETSLAGVLLIEPRTFADQRGLFRETYERERYRAIGVIEDFVQDNHSRSMKNVLRGMHFTKSKPQAQLVTVISGAIFDVVVDIRAESATCGRWFGVELTDKGLCQIYMPDGFAHGFCVLSKYADIYYKVSNQYDPNDEGGFRWNDENVGIEWPIKSPLISNRDSKHSAFKELSK
jgi:dTDP-4-dehydrorhamnose 3,5-epimerase